MLRRIRKWWRQVTEPGKAAPPVERPEPRPARGPDSGAAPPAAPSVSTNGEQPAPPMAETPTEALPAAPAAQAAEETAPPDARRQRAAERILEDEALTADLDDHAAKVLLDWGLALADHAARETATAPDADAALDECLRAVRRLMRRVARWAANPAGGDEDEAARWAALIELATAAYGRPIAAPPPTDLPTDPADLIARLRESLEGAV